VARALLEPLRLEQLAAALQLVSRSSSSISMPSQP
jgi:hypothetical protein